jgi:hypothetical protein
MGFTTVNGRGVILTGPGAGQPPEVKAFVELLRERKIVIDPTVAVFEDMFTARRGEVSPGYTSSADRLPPQVRRGFLAGAAAMALAAMACSKRQSFSVLREGTTLQMRCVSGLELDDLSRTFLDLAIMNSPDDGEKTGEKMREADKNFRNDFQIGTRSFLSCNESEGV